MSQIIRKPVSGGVVFFLKVRHKTGCSATGDDNWLEILDIGRRVISIYLFSKITGPDQLGVNQAAEFPYS